MLNRVAQTDRQGVKVAEVIKVNGAERVCPSASVLGERLAAGWLSSSEILSRMEATISATDGSRSLLAC